MPILDDVAAYLIAQGLAPAQNYPLNPAVFALFEGYMPDDQDLCMAVFETIGVPALTMLREVEGVSFQFRVRGSRLNYLPTRNQWQLGFNALQDSQPNANYALVQATHYGPMFFNDDRGRPNFITNFRVIKNNNDAT